jgi:hypothetical protein
MSVPFDFYPSALRRRLTPDLTEAQRFLATLDASPGAQFGFATFDDKHERSDPHRSDPTA